MPPVLIAPGDDCRCLFFKRRARSADRGILPRYRKTALAADEVTESPRHARCGPAKSSSGDKLSKRRD